MLNSLSAGYFNIKKAVLTTHGHDQLMYAIVKFRSYFYSIRD